MYNSPVKNQGYLPYCIYFAGWSLFETLSNTEIADGWRAVQRLSDKYTDKGGTIPGFLYGLQTEGLNGFKIADYKVLNSFEEIKSWVDRDIPVICDFREIWGIPWHTVMAVRSNENELYLKNSYGQEWHQGGYDWSGQNPPLVRGYVGIPIGFGVNVPPEPENPTQGNTGANSGYSGWVMMAPLDKMVITQGYGHTAFANAHPELYSQWGGIHPGWDLEAGIGTPVYSAENGPCDVVFAGWGGGFGNCVKTHEGNRTIIYAHLNSIAVAVGQRLVRGQIVGFAGATGYYKDSNGNVIPTVTGPHLHFQIDLDGIGAVDPYGFPISSIPR